MANPGITEHLPSDVVPKVVVPDEVSDVIGIVNYVILCGVISLFSIGANIVNIIVFTKQRFKDSINISLLGLAVADLSSSIAMVWTSICYNPLFQSLDLPFHPLDVIYATGGWPHVCFNRVTSLITAFITLERCLCIAMPLKVKTIITPFRTKIINVFMFTSMFVLFAPFYFVNRLEWKHSAARNSSMLIFTYTADRLIVESITFFIHSVFLSTVSLLSVIACTIILVVKLNKKTKWRQTTVQVVSTQESTNVKEKKVVKMVTIISMIYIVCYIPSTTFFLMMVLYPDYNYSGRLHNLIVVTWSMAFVLETTNSSVNIFVYFKTSSKFKETLLRLFALKVQTKG